jgi:hypothetical protein
MLVLGRVVFQGYYCIAEEYAKGRDKEEMDSFFDGERKCITVSEGTDALPAPFSDRSCRKIKTLAWWKEVGCPEKKGESAYLSNTPRFPKEHCFLEGFQASPLCPSCK